MIHEEAKALLHLSTPHDPKICQKLSNLLQSKFASFLISISIESVSCLENREFALRVIEVILSSAKFESGSYVVEYAFLVQLTGFLAERYINFPSTLANVQ